jgi:hypothetical protein
MPAGKEWALAWLSVHAPNSIPSVKGSGFVQLIYGQLDWCMHLLYLCLLPPRHCHSCRAVLHHIAGSHACIAGMGDIARCCARKRSMLIARRHYVTCICLDERLKPGPCNLAGGPLCCSIVSIVSAVATAPPVHVREQRCNTADESQLSVASNGAPSNRWRHAADAHCKQYCSRSVGLHNHLCCKGITRLKV